MSISISTYRIKHTLTATGQVLTVPFYFLEDSHLKVIRTQSNGTKTTLTLNTGYTVSGAGNEAGGSITMVAAFGVATDVITIKRSIPATQLIDYIYAGRFPAETHEKGLDKLTMLFQEMQDDVARTLRFEEDEDAISVLTESGRADKVLGFDSGGNVVYYNPASVIGITSPARQYASVSAMTTDSTITSVTSGQAIMLRGYYSDGDFGAPVELIVEASAGGVQSFTLDDTRSANIYSASKVNIGWYGAEASPTRNNLSTTLGDKNRDAFAEAATALLTQTSIDDLDLWREIEIPAGFYHFTKVAGEDHCLNVAVRGSYSLVGVAITGAGKRNTWLMPVGSSPDFMIKCKGTSPDQPSHMKGFTIDDNGSGTHVPANGIGFEQEDHATPFAGAIPNQFNFEDIKITNCSKRGIYWLADADGTLPDPPAGGQVYYTAYTRFSGVDIEEIDDGVNAGTCIEFADRIRVNTFLMHNHCRIKPDSALTYGDGTGIRIPVLWQGTFKDSDFSGSLYGLDIGVDDRHDVYNNGPLIFTGNYCELNKRNVVRVRGNADQNQLWGFQVSIKDNFITQSQQNTYSSDNQSACWNLTSCWGDISGNSYSSKGSDKPKIQAVNCGGLEVNDQIHPLERYGESPHYFEDKKSLRTNDTYWNFATAAATNLLTAPTGRTFAATEDFFYVGPVIKLPATIANGRLMGISNNVANYSASRPIFVRLVGTGALQIQARDSGGSLETIAAIGASAFVDSIQQKGIRISFGRRDGLLVVYVNDTCVWNAETEVAEVFDTVSWDADYFHVGGDSGNGTPNGTQAWGRAGLYDGTLSEDDYFKFIRGQLDLDFSTAGAKWLGVWDLHKGEPVKDLSGNEYTMTPDDQVTIVNPDADTLYNDGMITDIGNIAPSTWLTATGYSVDDLVIESTLVYKCLEAHTSGTFATDLAAGKWVVQIALDIKVDDPLQQFNFQAGGAAYTYNIDLQESGAFEGDVFRLFISKDATANPTIVVRTDDGASPANLVSLNNANAEDYAMEFRFDGTNWIKWQVCLNDL